MRCQHGPGGEGDGASPSAKRAKLGPGDQGCAWEGPFLEMNGHLATSCGFEPVDCAGCKKSVLRKDLPGHEGSCPESQIECPQGCGVTVVSRCMAEHRGMCEREEVVCPCPGCDERMLRADVDGHVAASVAVHLRKVCGRAMEMETKVAELGETQKHCARLEQKVAEQGNVIAKLKEEIALVGDLKEEKLAISILQRRAQALTRVFTWSTDSPWIQLQTSQPFTFTVQPRPGVESRGNVNSIFHRCHLFEVAFVWELTQETIHWEFHWVFPKIWISQFRFTVSRPQFFSSSHNSTHRFTSQFLEIFRHGE